jgi:hypothetical protein
VELTVTLDDFIMALGSTHHMCRIREKKLTSTFFNMKCPLKCIVSILTEAGSWKHTDLKNDT